MKQPFSVRLGERVAGFLRRVLPASMTRLVYRAGYFVARGWWWIANPAAYGSKVVVTRGDEVLLVRLTYGTRGNWDLPGGTAQGDESPEKTAARELFEEVGLSGELRLLGQWPGHGRGGRGVLHGYIVEVPRAAVLVVDEIEIAEARWFARDALPDRIAAGSSSILSMAF